MAWLCRVKRKYTSLRILPQCGARSVEQTYPYVKSQKASEPLSGLTESISLLKVVSGCYIKCKDRHVRLQGTCKIEETKPPKEHSNFIVTNPKDMEICDLPDKEFKIAVRGKFNELKKIRKRQVN